jgi:signal peptide peptidase SppA
MKLADIVQGPWAITPPMLYEITGIYARHMRGEKLDLAGLEAKLGRDLKNERKPYAVHNGVAVVELNGVLAKKANLFMAISGGTSMQIAGKELRQAGDDPEVQSIVLHIDSPGGTVDGTQELAAIVREVNEKKRVVALADGLMASAAYWVGSAASAVYISAETTHVGSIGVVATHTDYSKREEMLGIKTTEITAGKYKRIASDTAPLSEEGRDYIQAQVDTLYSIFVDAVAAHRGVSVEKVLSDMADGRIFIGRDAIAAGLVDGVSTLDALVNGLAAGTFFPVQLTTASEAGVASPAALDEVLMTLDEIKTAHPELAAELEKVGYERGMAEGKTLGATEERARILAVKAQSLPGHEALVEGLMFDGVTTGSEAAAKVVEAEKAARGVALKQIEADAPKLIPAALEPAAPVLETVEERAKAKWDADEKVRAGFGGNFGHFLALERQLEQGKVKIHSGTRQAA